MAVVGVLARVELGQQQQLIQRLEQLEGVEPISIGEEERIGIIIEAESIEAAHRCLTDQVLGLPGLLYAWPVFLHAEDDIDRLVARDRLQSSVAQEGDGNDGQDTS